MPVVLLCSAEYSEILLQGLIGSFTCSISLRVIRHADVLMDIEDTTGSVENFDMKQTSRSDMILWGML